MIIINIFKWFILGLYTVITLIPRYLINGIICLADPKKGKSVTYKGKPVIPMIMMSLTLTTYLICVFITSRWYVQKLKIEYLANDILANTEILSQEEEEIIIEENYFPGEINKYQNITFLSKNFKELLERNNETVAWLKVNNTNIDYPVVQNNNNEYYLKHDINKKKNSNGWIFADYRSDLRYFGTNTIIYGHNLLNKKLFGSLSNALKESWYKNEENHYIKLSTPTSNTIWRVFSVYTTQPDVYYLKTYFASEQEHLSFLKNIEQKSIYDFNADELNTNNKILTLSTCSDSGKKRMVVHAYMIKAEYR